MKNLWCLMFSACVLLLPDAGVATAQPINTNGGFEDATPGVKTGGDVTGWTLLAEGGATATFEIIEDNVKEGRYALKIDVTNLGSNPWDIQAVNEPFTVVPGTEYTYSIWAKADIDGLVVNFTVGSPTYAEWGRAQVIMTAEWQEVTLRFTPPAGASGARAPIHFGESANGAYVPVAFYIDDLQITGGTVGVEKVDQIPVGFELSQNYPNPFNPRTSFKFQVPSSEFVSLNVFDVLGREVATLVNEQRPAGVYAVTFDAAHLPSGVYFYTLRAGSLVETKRMVLAK